MDLDYDYGYLVVLLSCYDYVILIMSMLMYEKNLVLEFCLQNYLGLSDCSSLQHRISPGWLDCVLHILYDLASKVEPNE